MNILHILAVLLTYLFFLSNAHCGVSFTLIADEAMTKDISVNFLPELFENSNTLSGIEFNRIIPSINPSKVRKLLNHDSGVLDVTLNLNRPIPGSSASLLQFENLQQELQAHCWSNSEANELSAKLKLYVLPPTYKITNGQSVHHRLNGASPHTFIPESDISNFAPASMPIGVFLQTTPWVEDNSDISFFDVTLDPSKLLDTQRVGVAAKNARWNGKITPGVDLCLNRGKELQATGNFNQQADLCFDKDPNWAPWMEWDVTQAVRFWMKNNFDPDITQGFALFPTPNSSSNHQTRMNTLTNASRHSTAVISFASSSAESDCAAAGGSWGKHDRLDLKTFGTACYSKQSGQIIQPIVRPEWRPQLIITSNSPNSDCLLGFPQIPMYLEHAAEGTTEEKFVLENLSSTKTLIIDSLTFAGPNASSFHVGQDQCTTEVLLPGKECAIAVAFYPHIQGEQIASFTVSFRIEGQNNTLTQEFELIEYGDLSGNYASANLR